MPQDKGPNKLGYEPHDLARAAHTALLRRRLFWTAAVVAGSLFILLLVLVGVAVSMSLLLSANLQKARQHLPVIQSRLKGDSRFTSLQMDEFTGEGGSILVLGQVSSVADLAALQQIVGNTRPPVPVVWHVIVLPPEQAGSLRIVPPTSSRATTADSRTANP